jgi:DNA-binding NarL/FixJ family response regulator
MSSLRIFVADDHEVVRKGLMSLLQAHRSGRYAGEVKTRTDVGVSMQGLYRTDTLLHSARRAWCRFQLPRVWPF